MASASRIAIAVAFVLGTSGVVLGQDGKNVLVVSNAASPASVRIAEYYAEKRGVPFEQVLQLSDLPADPADGISRADFDRLIHGPVARWLAAHQAQDRILFIVLAKGIPLRINGTNADRTAASVDSELAVLYLRMTGTLVPLAGPLPNPYFLGDKPLAEAKRFNREDHSIYLVTRLDGYTVEDVLRMIDRGVAPSSTGRVVLDAKASWSDKGNQWLRDAAERLRAAGLSDDRVVFEDSSAVVQNQADVLGYYSWGSNDPAIKQRTFALKFAPGAVGGMFVSTDGRTFREPPNGWAIGSWNDKTKWFAGSPQSLAGDLIREGITGVAGHVAEPLLGHTIRPNVLFPAYFSGFSLAEAFYLAMPSLSWMTVVVGDPLCAPFASKMPLSTSLLIQIDLATEQPSIFAERRLTALATPHVSRGALEHLLLSESRSARGDRDGARSALERAVTLSPKLLVAQHRLAAIYEVANEYDRAIGTYTRILETAPKDVLALNNLAYAYAERNGDLARALPLAERAYLLAPRSAEVLDTYGWVLLMSGDIRQSVDLLRNAAKLAPANVDIGLHLVQALLTAGHKDAARAEFHRLRSTDPSIIESTKGQELASKLRD